MGPGGSGYKRDSYARELAPASVVPNRSSLIRSATAYPWHDSAFVTPDFSNMIIYQMHVGTHAPSTPGVASTFLDVIGKILYLVALGVNVLQPLPIDEMETDPSMGYSGADLFSPDFPYVVTDPVALNGYLANNQWLAHGQRFFAAWPRRYYFRSDSVEGDTAPGIPQIFMGQEFLEDKQWNWDPASLISPSSTSA